MLPNIFKIRKCDKSTKKKTSVFWHSVFFQKIEFEQSVVNFSKECIWTHLIWSVFQNEIIIYYSFDIFKNVQIRKFFSQKWFKSSTKQSASIEIHNIFKSKSMNESRPGIINSCHHNNSGAMKPTLIVQILFS